MAASDPDRDAVDALFVAALERPSEERAAFLRAECEDPALRAAVEAMLADYDEAAGLFDDPAGALLVPALRDVSSPPDGASPAPPDDPLGLEGTQVARYRVEEHVGGGGMGVVYRARDARLDRRVALKFLPKRLATHPEVEERFVQEARAAARLDHPNIATIHEIGTTADGRRYIAMAYYEGETLRERLDRDGSLPIDEAVRYARIVAEALSSAHEAGIVHRDVKPGNVMLTEEGEVKLLDFGLARALDRPRLTEPGRPLGTASYMSPEQVRGEEVRPASDVWAVGAVLFEMLSGAPPFQGERRAAVLHSVLHDEPPKLDAPRDVPDDVQPIIRRCLHKDPDVRYPSAEAFLDDLHTLRSEGERLAPDTRRARTLVPNWLDGRGLVVGSVVLLGVALAWVLWPFGSGAPGAESSSAPPAIAILPFESSGDDPPETAQNLHEDLVNRLSSVSNVRVISESSVRPVHNAGTSISDLADTLDAKWVLRGTIQSRERQLRVRAELIDPETGGSVWTNRYRSGRTVGDLFALQSDLTTDIVRTVGGSLPPNERKRVERRPTDSRDAYRFYLQGRTHLDQRTGTGLQQAVGYFRQAIDADSSFARAWSGLADAALLSRTYGHSIPTLDDVTAEQAARRALALDSTLAEAHASLGQILYNQGRGPAALRELRRATSLSNSYAQAFHWRATLGVHLGRLDLAIVHAKRAVNLDPLSPIHTLGLAACTYFDGRPQEALPHARRTVELAPQLGVGHFAEGYLLSEVGRHQDAVARVEEGLQLLPARSRYRTVFAGWPGVIYARAGDTTRALNVVDDIAPGPASALQRALVYQALGRSDRATSALREARPARWTWMNAGMFRYGSVLASLRDTPAYRTVRRRLHESMRRPSPDGVAQ
jgi:serine/threonine-protein kinase